MSLNVNENAQVKKEIKPYKEIDTKNLSGEATVIFENALEAADKDGNREISKEENSIFTTYIQDSSLKLKEKNIILGKKEIKPTSAKKQARLDEKEEKASVKIADNYFDDQLKQVVSNNVDLSKVRAVMEKNLSVQGELDKYEEHLKVLDEVLAILPKDFNGWLDIENQRDSLKGKLQGKTKKMHREVLDDLLELAEKNEFKQAKDDISARFEQKKKANPNQTSAAILNEIKSELEKEGKYVVINDETQYYENEYAKAFDNYRKNDVKKAEKEAYIKIALKNDTDVKGRKVKKEAIAEMKEAGIYGSDTRKAINQGRYGRKMANAIALNTNVNIKGQLKSHEELAAVLGKNANEKIEALLNTTVTLYDERGQLIQEVKTNDEINEALNLKSKNGSQLFSQQEIEALIKAGLVVKEQEGSYNCENLINLINTNENYKDELSKYGLDAESVEALTKNKQFPVVVKTDREDGKYDVQVLSTFLRQQVGIDNTLNLHHNSAQSELGYINRGINGGNNTEEYDLKNAELKKLVKIFGIKKKGQIYDLVKALFGTAGGTLAHGATAGVATWTNPYQTYLDCPPDIPDIEIDNNINIQQIIKDAGLDINIDVNVSIKTIIKDIMANEEAFLVVMPKLIAHNAIKSAILGGVLGLLNGFQRPEEIAAIPLKVQAGTLEQYVEQIKEDPKTKKYAPLLSGLALAMDFVKPDGQLDAQGFEDYLHHIFAGNDILNKDEAFVMPLIIEKIKQSIPVDAKEETKTEVTTPVNNVAPEEVKLEVAPKTEPVIVEKPVEETWTYDDTWQSMIYAYYPGAFGKQSYSEIKAAVDAFRRAHGISFQSGIPVGQKIQFQPFTVNGKTYYPNKNGADNKDGALITFGWESPFFKQKWDVKPKEISRLTVKEYKDGEKTVWYGVRTNADGTQTKTEAMETKDKAINALRPEASNNSDINLTITVRNEKGEVVETKKEKITKKEN